MALFRNTADLKLFADVHGQTTWSTLLPYVEQAENDYIIPLLSQEEYATFNAVVNSTANTTKSFEQMFTDTVRLLCFRLIARSLANYALYEAFPFLNTSVGDIGVMQQQSKEGTSTAAPQWRYESRRVAHLNVGDSYADKMLAFLEAHKDVFSAWTASTSFTINKDLFIADSKKLSEYIGTGESRRAFLSIRPYIRLAEKQYILPVLGKPLFDELKSELVSKPLTISAGNALLLPYVREALAWAAYYSALPFISIRITGDGVQVISRNDGVNNRNAAGKDDKEAARAQAGRLMDLFVNELRKYLDEKAIDYPLYPNSSGSCISQPAYRGQRNRKGSGHFTI